MEIPQFADKMLCLYVLYETNYSNFLLVCFS